MLNNKAVHENLSNKSSDKQCVDKSAGFPVCPTCRYKIVVLTGLRCPRCNELLTAVGCGGSCRRGCRSRCSNE